MSTITLPKKEYEELIEAKKRLDFMLKLVPPSKSKSGFLDTAFGLLKKSFGKKSSLFYVSKMRKSWRM